MKIAIAQLNPTIGDLAGNARNILIAAQDAAAQGARLLLTPELSLCGYPPRDLLLQPSFVKSMAIALETLAQEIPPQLAVLVGTVVANERSHQGGKPLFNSTAWVEAGQVQRLFHKRLLPTYDVFDEDRYFEPGEVANVFTLTVFPQQKGDPTNSDPNPTVRIGVTICEDLWNDEEFWGKRTYPHNPIADLALHSVDFTINLSASPYTVGKQRLRQAMLRHSALRYQQPILYVNQVGGNDDLLFDGNSFGLNRQGERVYQAKAFDTDLVLVEFDATCRDLVPVVAIAPLKQEPGIAPAFDCEAAEIWAALVLGVRDYMRKCGFRQVVIGLSGGIDSSLVAAIATAAIGAENVLGVLMPSPYSSDHSITDALELATNLGIKTETLPIGSLMESYDHTLAGLFAGTPFGLAQENLQSRIRGTLLMAVSNQFGHLLLSTGNKSEMAVGYCTLYGDMNGGLAAIADVPKTTVYSICHWLNTQRQQEYNVHCAGQVLTSPFSLPLSPLPAIPANVLTKAPSAELKPGQVDQDSLPPYDILDDILDRLVHRHQSVEEIIASGHVPTIVEQVVRLVSRAEFKRKQAPPGLKITDRAFGTGWRMPIANRWSANV